MKKKPSKAVLDAGPEGEGRMAAWWSKITKRVRQDSLNLWRLVARYPSTVLYPLLVLAVVLAVGVWGVTRVAQADADTARLRASAIALDLASDFRQHLSVAISPVLSLAALVGHDPGYQFVTSIFATFVPEVAKQVPGNAIKSLQLAPFGVIRMVYPLKGNEAAMGFDLFNSSTEREGAIRTVADRRMTLVGPMVFRQGGYGVRVRMPIFAPNTSANATFGGPDPLNPVCGAACYDAEAGASFWGFATALVDLNLLADASGARLRELEQQGYRYEVVAPHVAANLSVIARSAGGPVREAVEATVELPNNEWLVRVSPDDGSWTPDWYAPLLAAVVVVAVALAALNFAVLVSRRQHQMLLEALLPRDVIRDLVHRDAASMGPRILQADTAADVLLKMMATLLEGGPPDLRDVLFIRTTVLRNQDIYQPLNLGSHIKDANLDDDVARALMAQLGANAGGPNRDNSLFDELYGDIPDDAEAQMQMQNHLLTDLAAQGMGYVAEGGEGCGDGDGDLRCGGGPGGAAHDLGTLTGALALIMTPQPAAWYDGGGGTGFDLNDAASDAALPSPGTECHHPLLSPQLSIGNGHAGLTASRQLSLTNATLGAAAASALQSDLHRRLSRDAGGCAGGSPTAAAAAAGQRGSASGMAPGPGPGSGLGPNLFLLPPRAVTQPGFAPAGTPGGAGSGANAPSTPTAAAGAAAAANAITGNGEVDSHAQDEMLTVGGGGGGGSLLLLPPSQPPASGGGGGGAGGVGVGAITSGMLETVSGALPIMTTLSGAINRVVPPRSPLGSGHTARASKRFQVSPALGGGGGGGALSSAFPLGTNTASGNLAAAVMTTGGGGCLSASFFGAGALCLTGGAEDRLSSRLGVAASGGGGGGGMLQTLTARRQAMPPPPAVIEEVERLLADADSWQFDTWRLQEATQGHPLSVLGFFLMQRSGLIRQFKLNPMTLARLLRHIEAGYPPNPYHNATHAADVLQTLHVIVHGAQLHVHYLDRLGLLSAYFAAIVHDYGHPGVTNDFLIATNDPLAVRYNDRSPLENHHAAAAFSVLRKPELDVLAPLSTQERASFRKQAIELVLATDMKQHFSLLSHFNTVHRLAGYTAGAAGAAGAGPGAAPGLAAQRSSRVLLAVSPDRPDVSDVAPRPKDDMERLLALQVAMKAADLGHLGENLEVHQRWLGVLEQEFFLQGDREKELGLPISPLFDRAKQGVSKSQVGFYDFVAMPLVHALASAFPGAHPLIKCFVSNYNHWKGVELANTVATSPPSGSGKGGTAGKPSSSPPAVAKGEPAAAGEGAASPTAAKSAPASEPPRANAAAAVNGVANVSRAAAELPK
ncbi:hypothetical protein HYH03_004604 [Edaphochlamys debaryana]|uniref:Phosphodiesterase n=1 Tax=Edaphochlamys debaryana TaxID=47281 RepID=A0A835YH03_9CHLO|nr:hypothetical protein HYH03_004604 [Edaphochlamys debaryana]|eukprot:KAG2497449.1 hypothetical protein HYH03_004604 [Edaphochlamys debaryana]